MLLNTSTAAQPLMFIHCHVTDIIRLFSPSMSFSSLVFLPVLADLLFAPTNFRASLSEPYRLAPFDVGNLRSWLNSVHPIFELRSISRRVILVEFHNFNIRFLSHPKNLRRECPCSGSDDTYLSHALYLLQLHSAYHLPLNPLPQFCLRVYYVTASSLSQMRASGYVHTSFGGLYCPWSWLSL